MFSVVCCNHALNLLYLSFIVIYGSSQIFFLKNPLIYVISLVRVYIVYRSPHLS